MRNADMPAMPLHDPEIWVDPCDTSKGTTTADGLTKREHFAAMAMQALASGGTYPCHAAPRAIEFADALLAELEKTS